MKELHRWELVNELRFEINIDCFNIIVTIINVVIAFANAIVNINFIINIDFDFNCNIATITIVTTIIDIAMHLIHTFTIAITMEITINTIAFTTMVIVMN